jgi:hypothetical protein
VLVGWSDRTQHQAVLAGHLRLKVEVQLTVFKPKRLESPGSQIRDGSPEFRGERPVLLKRKEDHLDVPEIDSQLVHHRLALREMTHTFLRVPLAKT